MKNKFHEIIERKRKHLREDVWNYQRIQKNKLESFCKNLTGHKFWPWQKNVVYSIGGDVLQKYYRECELCGKREYKTEEEK